MLTPENFNTKDVGLEISQATSEVLNGSKAWPLRQGDRTVEEFRKAGKIDCEVEWKVLSLARQQKSHLSLYRFSIVLNRYSLIYSTRSIRISLFQNIEI